MKAGTEEPEVVKANHCFTQENWTEGLSLSVYNRPKTLVDKMPTSKKKPEEYLKTIPGYKPPAAKAALDAMAEPVPEPVKREPKIKQPVFAKEFAQITKDENDSYRLQQMEEIMSIRDYLAKSQGRLPTKSATGRDVDKEVLGDIPSLKMFERALLLPTES